MLIRSLSASLVGLCLFAQPAVAQTLQELQFGQTNETRVMAGVTIPFGGRANTVEAAPRFDLGFAQREQRGDTLLSVNSVKAYRERKWRRASLSLTFESNPRMLLNNIQVARFNLTTTLVDDREAPTDGMGVSTGAVLAGVAVIGMAVSVAVLADSVDAINDLTDPD